MPGARRPGGHLFPVLVGMTVAVIALTQVGTAHVGGLSDSAGSATVPPWLTFLTGGGIVAGSFLFTALLTDHEAINAVNSAALSFPSSAAIPRAVTPVLQAGSVGVLLVVITIGLFGSDRPTANLAILVVWAGWWAGYTASIYLIGNSWPLLNPWAAITRLLPTESRWEYPATWGVWPSVLGLLTLVFVEVVTPAGSDPELLAMLIIGYSLITIGGAVLFGARTWFDRVDPVARVFRMYGAVAPVQRSQSGIEIRIPTGRLTDADAAPRGETVFVIALLWVTTYDGFVSTPAWATIIVPLVDAGIPALVVYLVTLGLGFVVFLEVYRLAARKATAAADSYITPMSAGSWLVPALLPIAAAYHLAHFLGYFVSLSPAIWAAVQSPATVPMVVPVAVLPGWWPVLQLGIVLLGHLLAVWVAHALALELFPGRLRAIRSQAPFVIAMILYTVTSMWIIVQPSGAPPFV